MPQRRLAIASRPAPSNGYFISPEEPDDTAAELGALGAKLVGGNIIGSLRLESQDREQEFLSQAGASFCFPLMEKELMKTGLPNML